MIPAPESQQIAPRELPAFEGPGPVGPRPLWRWLRLVAIALAAIAIVGAGAAMGLARYGGAYAAAGFSTELAPLTGTEPAADPAARAEKLEKKLAAPVAPLGDLHHGRHLPEPAARLEGRELLRDAVCSTGSGVKLRDPRNGKEWIFDTPQGEMKILRKVKNPVWVKPDWAFIEEGYLPPKGMRDRVDDFSLGDYGLYMRDGYIIHGTIFKTLLGKRVTHGCIRLGDEDLKFAYDTVPVGARVFLY